ncbi:urease accessory protein UreF [Neomegalonema sp.]|uniref:urease accessory protein UreF n=1 Tax=Neomegalonema sp. TaxID=2039713 RepID=UPI0026029ECC|nr:urease accessory protein UreF [Neomegalonema sp.]MDD2869274.1 urease accessory protein UreF [Neomegalonema sp.]
MAMRMDDLGAGGGGCLGREKVGGVELLRLLTWLSPSFPIGAFAYSHGLEQAIHEGLIHDRESLRLWLEDLVSLGSGWNDAVLLAEAWRAARAQDSAALRALAELAEALAGGRERHMETMLQGEAFLRAAAPWTGVAEPAPLASPLAVGETAARAGLPLEAVLLACLHAFAANLLQGAVRLVPLGQSDALAILSALEAPLLAASARAACSTLEDLGSSTFLSDLMTLRHEALHSRVFRS